MLKIEMTRADYLSGRVFYSVNWDTGFVNFNFIQMRNSIKLAVFIIFYLSFLSGRAQLRFWKNYTQKLGGVLCMETFGDTTWTASAEGLTRMEKGVGRIVHYTPMNSDLDVNQLSGLQIDDQRDHLDVGDE